MNEKELPKRKNIRLQGYDYSSEGCYFITICTEHRKNLLSTIVGGDDLGAPKEIILKPYGKIVEKYVLSIEKAYGSVKVENYIIMPNHIHLLLLIDTYGLPRSCTVQYDSKQVVQDDGIQFYDKIKGIEKHERSV